MAARGVAMDRTRRLISHHMSPAMSDIPVPLSDQVVGGVPRIDDRDRGSRGLDCAHPVKWHGGVRGHNYVRFAEIPQSLEHLGIAEATKAQ